MLLLPPSPRRLKPKPGMVFGTWTVIRRTRQKTSNRNYLYACRCCCGALALVPGNRLTTRLPNNCTKCHKRRPKGVEADWQRTHVGHVYGYMLKLEREQELPLYEPWRDFKPFLAFYCEITETPEHIALQLPGSWSYYTMRRIDTSVNYSPQNITFRKFVQERAAHYETRRYWRRLGSRKLLTPELTDSYILFIKAFGLRPPKHNLLRYDLSRPNDTDNSRWVPVGRSIQSD